MRPTKLAVAAIILVWSQISFAQPIADLATKVDPMPDEDILQSCEYSLAPPPSGEPFLAAWIIFDRGLDFNAFYRSRQVRAFAASHRLAIVLALHCRSKASEDMMVDPARGIGRALFTALDQFAIAASRPELRSIPIVAMGWSGAGSLAGRLANLRPERFRAGILYAPGQYEPLGMDTIELDPVARAKPQLIVVGGADDRVGTERPYRYFKKYFDQGAPWTFAIQNKLPHCCLQNAESLILEWLDAVLEASSASSSNRRFGYLTTRRSGVMDPWKQFTFDATAARFSGQRCQPRREEMCAGWLPSSAFAESWLQFVRRPSPIAIWAP